MSAPPVDQQRIAANGIFLSVLREADLGDEGDLHVSPSYAAGCGLHFAAITRVRPRGEWVTAGGRASAKVHRAGFTVAAWIDDRVFYGSRALCGYAMHDARFYIEAPESEICDSCLFAGDEGVYRFFDVDDSPVYTGYSAALIDRLDQHRRGPSWWPLVHRGSCEFYPDEKAARAAEVASIHAEGPLCNRVPGGWPRELATATPT